jgi:hypothetical protein
VPDIELSLGDLPVLAGKEPYSIAKKRCGQLVDQDSESLLGRECYIDSGGNTGT